MTDPDELKDLEELTQHPGWSRVMRMADAEFGPAGKRYTGELERILATASGDATATQNLQVIVKARREIDAFLRGVEGRAQQLRARQEAPVSQSRRVPL